MNLKKIGGIEWICDEFSCFEELTDHNDFGLPKNKTSTECS